MLQLNKLSWHILPYLVVEEGPVSPINFVKFSVWGEPSALSNAMETGFQLCS